MFRTIQKSVVTPASSEALVDIIASTDQVKRRITAIIPTQTASVDLIANVDNDRVTDCPSNMIGATADPRIRIDKELKVGEKFLAGYRDNTGAGATYVVTVEYEEMS